MRAVGQKFPDSLGLVKAASFEDQSHYPWLLEGSIGFIDESQQKLWEFTKVVRNDRHFLSALLGDLIDIAGGMWASGVLDDLQHFLSCNCFTVKHIDWRLRERHFRWVWEVGGLFDECMCKNIAAWEVSGHTLHVNYMLLRPFSGHNTTRIFHSPTCFGFFHSHKERPLHSLVYKHVV